MEALKKQVEDVNSQLENMLDRIVEANSASVVNAYESRIEKLEREKLVLHERIAKSVPPQGRLEECIELSLKFLSSPWNIWKNGDFAMRQTVLRLAFSEPLKCSMKGVYGTPNLFFSFRYLKEVLEPKSEMVLPERIELSTSPLPRECSTSELRQQCGLLAKNICQAQADSCSFWAGFRNFLDKAGFGNLDPPPFHAVERHS